MKKLGISFFEIYIWTHKKIWFLSYVCVKISNVDNHRFWGSVQFEEKKNSILVANILLAGEGHNNRNIKAHDKNVIE